jgi:trehalose/maltose hydrolase-like predicted phosphorylase
MPFSAGLGAAEKQAEVFGYKGAQFPWCTVSFGRSAGCCDGKGGEELCLEQHITPDVVRTPSTPLFFLFFIAP